MKQFFTLSRQTRYVVIGIWNTIVGYSLFTLFIFLFPTSQYLLALCLATLLAGVNSYFTQRRFVWQSEANISGEIARFAIIFIGQFLVNAALLYVLVDRFNYHPLWTQYVLGTAIVISTYFLNKNWTFSK